MVYLPGKRNMPETPQYSICLLTYNRQREVTARWKELACLYGRRSDVELCVLDHASTDGTPQTIAAWHVLILPPLDGHGEPCSGWRTVCYNIPKNTGFGPGFNHLVGLSTGRIIVLLSDDVRVFGDFLSPIGDLIFAEDGRLIVGQTMVDHPAGWNEFGGRVVPYLYGHILAMRRAAWDEIGGFDPLFVPAGFEDVDFSHRAVLKGYKLGAVPELPARHESMAAERYEHTVRMKALFAKKWDFVNTPARP